MDRGAWRAIVHGVPKSQTQLKQLSACAHAHTHTHTHTHTQEGTEPQRIHRVTGLYGFFQHFQMPVPNPGHSLFGKVFKSFFFFSERVVNRARNARLH